MKKLLFFLALVCFGFQGWAQQATTKTVEVVYFPIENGVFKGSECYTGEIRCLSGRFSSETNNMGNLVVTFDDSEGNLVQGIFITEKHMAKELVRIAGVDSEVLFLVDYEGRIFSLEIWPNDGTPLYVACMTGRNNKVYARLDRAGYLALKHQIEKSEDNGLLSFSDKLGEQFCNYLGFRIGIKVENSTAK